MSVKKKIAPTGLVYDEITQRAETLGISVAELFRLIGKKSDIFQRWKKQNPKSIETYNQLKAKLDELETAKKSGSTKYLAK